nr:ABC transporter substrate-binding protein [Micromonospora sp. DSM 115978]
SALGGGDTAGKTVAVVGIDTDSSRDGATYIAKQVEAAGIEVVYNEAPIPLAGLSDATPILNSIMRANDGLPPDLIIFPGDFASTTRLTEALKAAGYEGETINAVGYDPRLAGFEGLDGAHTILQWAPAQAEAPGVEQLRSDFAAHAPDQVLSLPAMAGYWAADMFLDALEQTGPDLTVDSFLGFANGGEWEYYPDGGVPLSRWPVNHSTATPCAALMELVDGAYTEAQPLSCGRIFTR